MEWAFVVGRVPIWQSEVDRERGREDLCDVTWMFRSAIDTVSFWAFRMTREAIPDGPAEVVNGARVDGHGNS